MREPRVTFWGRASALGLCVVEACRPCRCGCDTRAEGEEDLRGYIVAASGDGTGITIRFYGEQQFLAAVEAFDLEIVNL